MPVWTQWLVLAMTCALAPFIFYHLIEVPMIRFGHVAYLPSRSKRLTQGPFLSHAGLCTLCIKDRLLRCR
jgi:hypothetical protein